MVTTQTELGKNTDMATTMENNNIGTTVMAILLMLFAATRMSAQLVITPENIDLWLKAGSTESVCLSYIQNASTQSNNYVRLHVKEPLQINVKVKGTSVVKKNNMSSPVFLELNFYHPDNTSEEIAQTLDRTAWSKYLYNANEYKIKYEGTISTIAPQTTMVGPNIYKIDLEITCTAIPKEAAGTPFPDITDLPPYLFWNINSEASRNHVATFEPTISETEGITTVAYYDGFGKEQETVQVDFVQKGKNVVSMQEYDGWGRKGKTWSPISVDTPTNDYFTTAEAIKQKTSGAEPFSYPVYEPSTIGRESELFGDGKEWHDAGKAVRKDYFTNKVGVDSLECMHLQADVRNMSATVKITGKTPTGSLYVTRTEDEDGRTEFTFKDSFDKTILIRRVDKKTSSKKSYLDTYYVYKDMDKLCAVVPPMMTEWIVSEAAELLEEQVERYVYCYEYDDMGRCVAKKLPGCDWVQMVYDKADRMILSQDGEQRKNNRMTFHMYDVFGRECVSGTAMANMTNLWKDGYTCCRYTGESKELMGYECKGMALGEDTVLSVNFYDNYKFLGNKNIPIQFQSQFTKLDGFCGYYATPQGQCTGNIQRILGDEDYFGVYTAVYFDALGRVCQKRVLNYEFENEVTSYKYNVGNSPTMVRHDYGSYQKDTEIYEYTYDKAGRLLKETLSLNGASPIAINEKEYDELGRLSKERHLQNNALLTEYQYNNRSWITSIAGSLFSEKLHYNDLASNKLYSGKIARMDWRTDNNQDNNYYHLVYDKVGRLTEGRFQGSRLKHSELLQYDQMGNVTKLMRRGTLDNGKQGIIDYLTLNYNGNQLVKVSDTADGPYFKGAFHFVDGADKDTEYAYDANGNMTMDLNKGITKIKYNVRNLPQIIRMKITDDLSQTEEEKEIRLYYDADGGKRAVEYSDDEYTAYTENRIFENGELKYLLFEGGYASFENGKDKPSYHFYIKDHLGNIRIVADEQGNVEQENHYYPYGTLLMGGNFTKDITSNQRFRFNGKELDRMYGLDWHDFGARWYNSVLCQWTTMDPLCEKYYSISPYAYCANDPMNAFDPNGARIYMLFYSYGNKDDYDEDFYAAALTRYNDIKNSKDFSSKSDKIFLLGFNDLSKIKNTTENIIKEYSNKYGKTTEVGFFSHGGFDGPIGTIDNSEYFDYSKDGYQMKISGWEEINFNWDANASISFYGCNTANSQFYYHPISFAQKISKSKKFNNINVYGQESSVYFSKSQTEFIKRNKFPIINSNYHFIFPRNYMVAPKWGKYRALYNGIYPMLHFRNGVQE